jgi:hypothetical protein
MICHIVVVVVVVVHGSSGEFEAKMNHDYHGSIFEEWQNQQLMDGLVVLAPAVAAGRLVSIFLEYSSPL